MNKEIEKKIEIEKIEIVKEMLLHLKDTERTIMAKEFSIDGKPTGWEFLTLINEAMRGPKGEQLQLRGQFGKRIDDAKTFERALERFNKDVEKEFKKIRREAELKVSGIILPGQQPRQNPRFPPLGMR